MKKRLLLMALACLICTGSTYFLLKPNRKKQVAQALNHLKEGRFVESEKLLYSLPAVYMGRPIELYHGYVAQAQGALPLARAYLQAALEEATDTAEQSVITEILLAQAINAYLEGCEEQAVSLVAQTHPLPYAQGTSLFFDGLVHYIEHRPLATVEAWHRYHQWLAEEARHSLGPTEQWLVTAIETSFSPLWRDLHLAYSLIEIGDLTAARALLFQASSQGSEMPSAARYLTALLRGWAEFTVAAALPAEEKVAAYSLGCEFLKEATPLFLYDEREKCEREHQEISVTLLKDSFSREKHRMMAALEAKIQTLLFSASEEYRWGIKSLQILQQWQASPTLERLAHAVADKLLDQRNQTHMQQSERLLLCQAIKEELLDTPFYNTLMQKMVNAMRTSIKSSGAKELFDLWPYVAALTPDPDHLIKELASLSTQELFDMIRSDANALPCTRNWLLFWNLTERLGSEREALAAELLYHAQLFWHNDRQEIKGMQLMEISLQVANWSPVIQKEIGSFLIALYKEAESSNMIQRLCLIYDALEHFAISHEEMTSHTSLANHLADAEYFYSTHNYLAAQAHANWVLRLDPQNTCAHHLVGLCAFHLRKADVELCYLPALESGTSAYPFVTHTPECHLYHTPTRLTRDG